MVQSALLIVLLYYVVTSIDTYFLGWETLIRPLVIAPLTGLVLGDLKTGLIMGASLEAIFMGVMAIGGSIAADPTTSSIIAVAYTVLVGGSMETSLAMAMPIGTIMVGFRDVLMPVFSAMAPYWERLATKGNLKKFSTQVIACSLTLYQLVPCAILYICVVYGFEFFGDPNAGGGDTTSWLITGLTAGTYMLIAVGFAILGSMIIAKETVVFFFVGYVLTEFLGLDTVAIAVLGIAVAVTMFYNEKRLIDFKNKYKKNKALNETEDFF